MVFSSVGFLFFFLPATLLAYFAVPKRFRAARNVVLLLASLAFYAYGEFKFTLLLIGSILLNYAFGLLIARTVRAARAALILGIIANLGILIYFKYSGFLVENLNALTGAAFAIPKIMLPLGVSFFTFQGLSYIFDIYSKRAQAQINPLNVALYIAMFPKLVLGPIVRFSDIQNEIVNRRECRTDIASGTYRFIFGLGKKVILSNTIAGVANTVFAMAPADMSVALAWIGAIAYMLQIYFDFSGYSDMAIGLGRIFGFHFAENFNFPYIARSITDFWRRWHISLSSWFRDYVYIPLGGNRVGQARLVVNILVVWLLTGIWHGAAWNFIVWGLYFGVLLLIEKFFLLKHISRAPRVIQHIYALILVLVGWVLFRAPDIGYALSYVKAMAGFGAAGLWDAQCVYMLVQYGLVFAIGIIFAMPVSRAIGDKLRNRALFYHGRNVCAAVLLVLSVIYMVNSSFNAFIYFRF
ncbi:MAG: MBOAT family O-acyltransferase [Clostridia bacterium]